MTGFGKAVEIFEGKKITVEIKSLNSKQLDLMMRVPASYREIELELRNLIAGKLLRGKVEVIITCEASGDTAPASLNVPALLDYKTQIEGLANAMGVEPPADLFATLLRLPDALKSNINSNEIGDEERKVIIDLTTKATDNLLEFRQHEGERLSGFFEEKIQAIGTLLEAIEPFETARVEKIKARIIDSLSHLEGVSYDNNRLEQELIFYIEKLDITEEKIRLRNHLNYFLETLHTTESQGKKLGFITQEMGREINTTGSKSNQAEMQKIVVEMKDHLEQIKEQVLNVL